MIPDPPANARAHPYRGLSVQEIDVPLTQASLTRHLLGREVYRRTEYLALRGAGGVALIAVRKASPQPLFSPVVEARVLAGPDQTAWVDSPATDVGNATALAKAAQAHHAPNARAYVVLGRFAHVNFIWEPTPVPVRVTEVVPPSPPKLLAQAEQAVAFDEDLPPIRLDLDAVSVPALAAAHPAGAYLLPCRGTGADVGGPVAFLDTRPATRGDWLLIGCQRSAQLHRHFYGDEPARVDLCPRARAGEGDGLTLTKCCLIERGLEVDGGTAAVAWGANLDEVRQALRRLLL